MKNIVIVGGGAAGFFCAANLDKNKYKITILEQNTDVLQKVKISGGGRCNVTHACFDPRELTQFYPRGNKELRSVFSKFQPADTMEWFGSRGVELKIEADNRVFPVSNSSQSIINALYHSAIENGVEVKTKILVKEIIKENNAYTIITNNENFHADIVIYTTGSQPKSLKIIENIGHTIISPVPSLFTFNVKDKLLTDLMGTSFENVEIRIPILKTEESGAMLITHWGLSGPAVLRLSAWQARELAEVGYQVEIEVNFLAMDRGEVQEMIRNFKEENPKRTMAQAKMFPITNRFWHKILEVSGVDFNKQIANLSAKEMQNIVENLCKKRLKVSGKSTFKEEFVTCGGVDLKEIDFKNMASKILPNFHIAGEVLNIDAVTGGFNFQACWSEAFLIAQYLNEESRLYV